MLDVRGVAAVRRAMEILRGVLGSDLGEAVRARLIRRALPVGLPRAPYLVGRRMR